METIVEIAQALHSSVFELGVLVVTFLLIVLATGIVLSVRQTETYKRFAPFLDLLDEVIAGAIANAAGAELGRFEHMATVREEQGLPFIDPRMLYVINKVELWVEKNGFPIDLVDIHDRAQHIFDLMKKEGYA